jgi:hypothetical protein
MHKVKVPGAAVQLAKFIARYSPEVAQRGKAVLAKFRTLVPPAIEMVYDNYNFLVIGFAPSERPSEAAFSVVFYPSGVSLCFLQGARLIDPHGLLQGSGSQVRHVKLPTARSLDEPNLRALIASALEASPKSYAAVGRRKLIIKSISAKQRPRRLT